MEVVMELNDTEESVTALNISTVRNPINVRFQNISLRNFSRKDATDRQYILKNICGTFYSGRLTALIGTSRSGKTTLLNLLAGLKSNHSASNIKLNERISDTNAIRKTSSFITHDFPLLDNLTTFETLKYAADFKLGQNMSTVSKLKLVNNIIDELNLAAYRNLSISHLNGSERNVLALAIGLVTNSSVLYFDLRVHDFEDKALLLVLQYLRFLAGHGRTIICAFDHPTTQILQRFDDLMVLADGQCLYCGSYEKIFDVFSKVGFVRPPFMGHAEFILDVASHCGTNGTCQQVMLSDETNTNKHISIAKTDSIGTHQKWCYPIGCWSQFTILMQRTMLCMRRDFMYVQLRLITNILIGLLVGIVFYDFGNEAGKIYTNTAMLFFMVMFVFFVNIFPNIISFPADITVFLEENRQRHYSINVYFTVKILTELSQHIIGASVFLVISCIMTNQPAANFIYLWIVFIMTTIVSLGISLVIVTAIQNSTLRMYTILVVSIPMMIFSGMFIKPNELPLYLTPAIYISYFRHAFEGSMQSIYGFNRPKLICSDAFCYFKWPNQYLDAISMGGDRYWYDIGGLAIWIVVLFILFYVLLRYRVARRK